MNIFTALKEEEGCFYINYPLVGWRLKPKPVPLQQSSVTPSSLDRVTVILIQYQII
jgi:hypothetical protein